MQRPALWILMVALIALLPMATSEPAAANHAPASRITRSYYVGSSSSDKAVLLGLAPIGFLAIGWVTNPLPSGICGALSFFALVLMQLARGPEVRHELSKRLHL